MTTRAKENLSSEVHKLPMKYLIITEAMVQKRELTLPVMLRKAG